MALRPLGVKLAHSPAASRHRNAPITSSTPVTLRLNKESCSSPGHAEPQAAAVAGPDRRPVAAAAEAEGQAAGRMPRQAPLESRRQSALRYGFFWQRQASVFSKVV